MAVDAFLFSDGTLPGADKAGLEDTRCSDLREERALREEMLRQARPLRRQHLISLVQAIEVSAEPAHLLADACLSHFAGTGRILLHVLGNPHAEEQFRARMNQVMGDRVPVSH